MLHNQDGVIYNGLKKKKRHTLSLAQIAAYLKSISIDRLYRSVCMMKNSTR